MKGEKSGVNLCLIAQKYLIAMKNIRILLRQRETKILEWSNVSLAYLSTSAHNFVQSSLEFKTMRKIEYVECEELSAKKTFENKMLEEKEIIQLRMMMKQLVFFDFGQGNSAVEMGKAQGKTVQRHNLYPSYMIMRIGSFNNSEHSMEIDIIP